MRANLYLHKDSFVYNGIDSEEAFAEKLNAFADDIAEIKMSPFADDVFYSSADLVCCEVFRDTSFSEAIERYVDNDRKGILYTLFANESKELDNVSLAEIKGFCSYQQAETEVNSVVFLNHAPVAIDKTKYITFDQYEIVYSKSSWLSPRRQILGNHPGSPSSFIRDCRSLFPSLCFHDNCESTLSDEEYEYLNIVPRKIVYYLSCLNDGFRDVMTAHTKRAPDANSILRDFSSIYGLEEMGSLQRDATKKPLLTFDFTITYPLEKKGQKRDILCEPHLKISKPDENYGEKVGDRFNPRIYFSFGEKDIEYGRILVGSIGSHLA